MPEIIVHDVATYVTWHIPRPAFYIENILPKQGTLLLYGAPKVKKSWLTEYMGFCLATGTPWLGFSTEQSKILISNFEISPISYAWRLKDMAVHFSVQDNFFYEVSPMLLYLDNQENFNLFTRVLRRVQPQVLILDCLSACFGGDENSGEAMASFIEKLNIWRTDFDCSIVIVHHCNKNPLSTSSIDKARGHSKLTGWVDTLAYLCEQPNGLQLQWKCRQATHEIPNTNIIFEDYLWRIR